MHIYLAASWPQRRRMRGIADELAVIGIQVTSRWIYSDMPVGMGPAEIGVDPESAKAGCIRDLQDINAAHRMAVFTDIQSSTGGLHVEYGYALSREKPIDIIGPKPNVFYSLEIPGIRHFPSSVYWMERLREERVR